MIARNERRLVLITAVLISALAGQSRAVSQDCAAAELVDPKVLRVCADPRNLPFSNAKGEGFENKLAELVASKLGKSVSYTFYPGSIGFVRNTLGSYRCDIIMGFPQGDDIAQVTNPYYSTAYALVLKQGSSIDRVTALSDPALKDKRIGIVAGTPPSNAMIANGLMARAKPYPLMVDTRVDSSAEAMIKDIETGDIDAGILWGPIAGYFATRAQPQLTIVPLAQEKAGPRISFRIGMAVRHQDQEFKRVLNRLIQENQHEIDALLLSYGVPILDSQNRRVTAASQGH